MPLHSTITKFKEVKMTLGENIYRYRTEKNWSQGDLAEALDVSRQSISKWENNLAAPDLDKLIKLRTVFGVTLDELVLGIAPAEEKQEEAPPPTNYIQPNLLTMRHVIGFAMLLFGLVFFLLSIFWGNSLYFSEEVGELTSCMIVLISLFILAPYNTTIISICGIVYVVYCIVCFAIMNVTSIANGLFLFLASFVILTWFIICGLHASKEQ